jgi:hypothetical protein
MKYLVVKGWLGFGDRLQSLKMAIKFALDNHLQIYVDWTDVMWSHGTESFYSYFELQNIQQLKSLNDIPSEATYYPAFWKDNIKKPFSHEIWHLTKQYNLDIGVPLNTIQADVVVLSCIGRRLYFPDNTFFANVFRVIHPDVIKEVKRRQQTYNLSQSLGVHIRGTDRTKKRGRELPIQMIASTAFGYRGFPMIVVTDDATSFEIWKRFYPTSVLMSTITETLSNGIHNASKHELTITKNESNINTLIDFFTLMSCNQGLSTYTDSRFFQEARRLRTHISTILQ